MYSESDHIIGGRWYKGSYGRTITESQTPDRVHIIMTIQPGEGFGVQISQYGTVERQRKMVTQETFIFETEPMCLTVYRRLISCFSDIDARNTLLTTLRVGQAL